MLLGPCPATTLYGEPVLNILFPVSTFLHLLPLSLLGLVDSLWEPQWHMLRALGGLEQMLVKSHLLHHRHVCIVARSPALLVVVPAVDCVGEGGQLAVC